jgi:tetratricopeptide (TPR) repeat protein
MKFTYTNLVTALLITATCLSVAADETGPRNFNARIQRKTGRWLPVQVTDISNGQLTVRMKGAELRLKIQDIRGFSWVSPTPVETARTLIASNRFEDVLSRLALFKKDDFLEPDVPASMHRDSITKLIADAFIGLNRLDNASDIMQYITEDADVIIRRIRIHKAHGDFDKAVALAQKHTAELEHTSESQAEMAEGMATGSSGTVSVESAAVTRKTVKKKETVIPGMRWSDNETAQLYYELGTALMAREEYEEALDELLKVKVLYRSDMDLVAQSEMRAMECYCKLHQYPRALRALSNIIARAEYAVVKPEASTALTNVLMGFEKEKELKRRIGGE